VTSVAESARARKALRQTLASLQPEVASDLGERIVRIALFLSAAFAIAMAIAVAISLLVPSIAFFEVVSPWEFFTGTVWSPDIGDLYGVLPLVVGTLIIAAGACAIGLPLGLGAAIYLREYAPTRVREVVKPVLEVLAGIPTVVLGFFAILVVAPILQSWFGASFFSGANAIVVIGILIIPIVSSLSEDALTAVPRDLRDGALALGATRLEATGRVVLPAAISGIGASFILAFGRAVGETMVVLIAAGQQTHIELNIFDQMTSMAGFIAKRATGDLPAGTTLTNSLFAVGITLFGITLLINIIGDRLRAKYREEYE